MQWKDRSEDGRASQLEVVEEFRSFVRPSWRPTLSEFCTNLTGITQVGNVGSLYNLNQKKTTCCPGTSGRRTFVSRSPTVLSEVLSEAWID